VFIPLGDDVQKRNLPIVPSVLILLNILVFVYQTRLFLEAGDKVDAVSESFFSKWALIPADLAEGQVMGLMSHMFLHGDFMHILGNMVVLWAFACTLEAGLGSLMLLGMYMFWGLGAGAIHAGLNLESDVPMVGASGAIAGLMGAYTVAYGPQARIKALFFFAFRPFIVHIPAFIFGGGWIFMQLWHASNDPNGFAGVAWFAHIGGFAIGALTMLAMRNDTDQALIRDKSGALIFEERESDNNEDGDEELADDPTTKLPDACPHCGSNIHAENILSPVLAKCGNESCDRLVYPSRLVVHS